MEDIKSISIGPDLQVIKKGAPSPTYVGATWGAFMIGFIAYLIGLWNAEMELNEKGYYFTVIMFGLYSSISVQKAVRDSLEGIPVSGIYYGVSWICLITSLLLLIIGLWNATLELSEKGFYAMAFTLCLFASMTIQKNVRDQIVAKKRYLDSLNNDNTANNVKEGI